MQTKEIFQKSSDILLDIMAALAVFSIAVFVAIIFLLIYVSSF